MYVRVKREGSPPSYCAHCGKAFDAKRPTQRFDTEKCRRDYWKERYKTKYIKEVP